MSGADEVNLYARYEARLLSGHSFKPTIIPAVIITGFLGSGKTTLVQHVLRNRGSLRIAVLVNEVGRVDVDSELVNAKQSNAALGLPAADLSGGCICCSRSEDLAAALRRLRAPPAAAAAAGGGGGGAAAAAPCDYLLVETSGAADAGPLAEALIDAGFRLDAVVAVVDAEAGREALQHPVARAQVCCADVVVLNKCDLLAGGPRGCGGGGLGALSDLEDALSDMAPGVRVVRARYGEVPLTTVLDVVPVEAAAAPPTSASGAPEGAANGGGGSGGGEGFMSHESMPSITAASGGGYRLASGPLTADGLAVGSARHTKRRAAPLPPSPAPGSRGGAPPAAPADPHEQHHHHHGHSHGHGRGDGHGHGNGQAHSHAQEPSTLVPDAHAAAHAHAHAHAQLHSGFFTESLVAAGGRPCSLVAFAEFVTRRLVREPALLRSKGVLWFGERRQHRFTFHLSGRRRVELSQEGPWEGPPASSIVFIGTDAAAMAALRQSFEEEVVRAEAAESAPAAGWGEVEVAEAEAEAEAGRGAEAVPAGGEAAAVAVLAERIAGNDKMEVLATGLPAAGAQAMGASGSSRGEGGSSRDDGGSSSGGGGRARLVAFTTRSSPLHGINGEELNAELVRRANAEAGGGPGRLLLAGVTAPGAISAVTGVQARDRVQSLLVVAAASPEDAELQAAALLAAAEPILRRAWGHVHNCKCDVAGGMQALQSR
ncbi:hypothetical protein HYH02_000254 [Chlamydomonas schloesseri]|uniref:CobW C-terminal domain-containing protein n=1 Tax=Chlamydomonas schloesseri TaxID=2026947 RepID=A0A835WMM6_9CHLO|nr:hypothetical protein HYH02_000254 [Chlamydomonas schloesseri]|eukprot:KAG2450152.1 hypothetical protein HYH02_000254 [Chlamydomonas schloesseri]